ncbi:hypothetical protein WKI13_11645 [Teredinibacter turnerae]|uniref:hypothetical protein n=1 Tax=Teredinibacter turnerae TaxID=2426 RepID=UPI00037B9411|nr:hypothetical protein [Teredinibacter turnerae]
MSDYIIGGWTQNPTSTAPNSFAVTQYGMITNLPDLTSGTSTSPGWSPRRVKAPQNPGTVMWTYGGGGALPDKMPKTPQELDAIVAATLDNQWGGVDFDDESNMNVENIIDVMTKLKSANKQTSYTFLAGWDYNNPQSSNAGKATNLKVEAIAKAGVADRFCLMCYAASMWNMNTIIANVGPALDRTLALGAPAKSIILALTRRGLNQENLDYFIEQVTSRSLGGLFIWDYTALSPNYLKTIESELLQTRQ